MDWYLKVEVTLMCQNELTNSWGNVMSEETEKGYAWPSKTDRDGEYSFLLTECGNSWYSVNTNPMRRNGCICPKCGKIVRVVIPE